MKKIFFSVLLIACGFMLGMQVGIRTEKNKIGKWFINEAVQASTSNVISRIKALEWLEKGQIDKTKECIESVVDVELAYLGTTLKDTPPLIEDKSRVLDAIRKVKDYREKHPGHQMKPDLNDGVATAFKLIVK